MTKPSFRVYFVPHGAGADRRLTGVLMRRTPRDLNSPPVPTAFGATEDDVLAELEQIMIGRLATEEDEVEPYLFTETLTVHHVKVQIHPLSAVKATPVIGAQSIPLFLSYASFPLEGGGHHLLLPRFGGWFIVEDLSLASDVLGHAVSTWLLGASPRWVYDFRGGGDEWVTPFTPRLLDRRPAAPPPAADEDVPTLRAVADELVSRAREGKLPSTVGHAPDVAWLVGDRLPSPPPSLLVVGPPGVGKTTFVRHLARAYGSLSRKKRHRPPPRIWSTSTDRILAGMVYLGMWQQRCIDLVAELDGEGDYLYVGRLSPVLASQHDGSSIGDLLQPALQGGRISVIAECTPEELAHARRANGSLLGHFSIVHVPQPSTTATLELTQAYARKKGLPAFDPIAAKRLLSLLDTYTRSSAFPGKAFRFLDWLAEARTPRAAPRDAGPTAPMYVVETVAAFSRWTGIPVDMLSDHEALHWDALADRLRARVVGQDAACEAAARVLLRYKAGLNDPDRPTASLLFVGPSGVGKTQLAKTLARTMFGSDDRLVRVDMSEYAGWGAAARLIDVSPGTRSLARRVAEQPLSVVLLDEIEKAGPDVFDLLLGVLGEGRLTDASGRLVDFRGTLIVMTSNLGASAARPVGFGDAPEGDFSRAVRDHFRPELFQRIDRVLPFRALSPADVAAICELELAEVVRRPGFQHRNISLEVTAAAKAQLAADGYHPARGARPLRRLIEERVVTPLAAALSADPSLANVRAWVGVDGEPAPVGVFTARLAKASVV